MTRLQVEILNLILRMANEFPQRKEQLIFIINNYDLLLSVLTVRKNFLKSNHLITFLSRHIQVKILLNVMPLKVYFAIELMNTLKKF
jgi:hypothetical protein